jgi:hypothetical protein
MVDPEYVAAQTVARHSAPPLGKQLELERAERADNADKAGGLALADLMRQHHALAADRRRQLLQAVERLER